MRAKFPGTCRKCGATFTAGTLIDWSKGAGSTHVTCPSKSSAAAPSSRPAPVAKVDTTAAPFETSEKWDPCKRASFERRCASEVGEIHRYVKRGPFVRGAVGDARQAPVGVYVVAGIGPSRYESTEDNEDTDDMSGPGWHVTLYLRQASGDELAKIERTLLGEEMARIGTAIAGMVQRGAESSAKAAMDAASKREGWGRCDIVDLAELGESAVAQRKATLRRLWTATGRDSSYVSAFEVDGKTWHESFHYVYDWDLPTVIVAPLAIVEQVNMIRELQSLGYAIQRIVRRQEQAAKDAAELAAKEARKLPASTDLGATFGIEIDQRRVA